LRPRAKVPARAPAPALAPAHEARHVVRVGNALPPVRLRGKNKKEGGRTKRNRKANRKTRKHRGGSTVYKTSGNLEKFNEQYEGKDFFRKMLSSITEPKIAEILRKNPHPNIVSIYRITDGYIDMEELQHLKGPTSLHKKALLEAMNNAKDHLQSLGIMYVDWKPDNVGITADGIYKLFDFDGSGITNADKKTWLIRPSSYWSYRQAIANGLKSPIDIDNFAFEINLVRTDYVPLPEDN
jgi:serine/threonine protein kinase